jgi:transposase
LADPNADQYKTRQARPRKVDPFVPYLQARIEAARPDWIPASVLFREIQERGYTGGASQLRAYLSPFKRQPKDDPVVRFETEPGQQAQADFTFVRKGRDPLLAFVMTMGYSRASFVKFTIAEDTDTLCNCLREALPYFGGVPEHILFDNPKTVVIDRDAYGLGLHRFNATLLSVADEFGFRPRLCRPYRARTKGKVERFNHYLKNSFLVPLNATLKQSGLKLDVVAANAHIGPWLETVANTRVHATHGEQPIKRLILEREHLQPLPATIGAPRTVVQTAPAMPIESLQHPLSVYDALLEVA